MAVGPHGDQVAVVVSAEVAGCQEPGVLPVGGGSGQRAGGDRRLVRRSRAEGAADRVGVQRLDLLVEHRGVADPVGVAALVREAVPRLLDVEGQCRVLAGRQLMPLASPVERQPSSISLLSSSVRRMSLLSSFLSTTQAIRQRAVAR